MVTEARLRSEERYRMFIALSSEGIWRFELEQPVAIDADEGAQIDAFYRYAYLAECNDAMAQMYGTTVSELISARLGDLMPRNDPQNDIYLRMFIRSGYRLMDAKSHEIDRQGQPRYFLNNLIGVIEDGCLIRAWGTQRDMTNYQQMTDMLTLRSQVLDSMVEGVSISDEQGFILYTNPAEDAMFGYKRGELIGQHVTAQNTYPAEENRRIVEEVIAQLKVNGSWQGEFRNRKKDGTPFTTFARITAVASAGKQYWVCVQEDITERRRVEEALRSSQERLALAYQAARLGTFDWNIQNNEVVWTREEEALYGLPPGGFGGSYDSWKQAVHPDDRENAERAVLNAAMTGQDLDTEFRVVWPDGSVRWLAAKARVIRDSAGQPFRMIGVNEDITERKRSELTKSFLAEVSAQLTASLDYATTLQRVARAVVPTLADFCVVYIQAADGWIERVAAVHRDARGEQLLRELQVHDHIDPASAHPIARILRTGETEVAWSLASEHVIALADNDLQLRIGHALQPRAHILAPLVARERTIGAISFVLTDSGRQYTREDVALAEEVVRRAAMAVDNARLYQEAQEAIRLRDTFFSIAAHELKTPLTSLLGQAQLLERRAHREGQLSERDQHTVGVVVAQAQRLNRLVLAMLDIARIEQGKLSIDHQLLDVAALVRRIVDETQPTEPNYQIHYQEMTEPIQVRGDALRLEQVIQNLIGNAIKYSSSGSSVVVRVGVQGDRAYLQVSDQGIGIPRTAFPNLFQRFFRASNAFEQHMSGMGIGLYVVKEIVTLHGGKVEVESTEGEGSTFTVWLPLADALSALDDAHTTSEEPSI